MNLDLLQFRPITFINGVLCTGLVSGSAGSSNIPTSGSSYYLLQTSASANKVYGLANSVAISPTSPELTFTMSGDVFMYYNPPQQDGFRWPNGSNSGYCDIDIVGDIYVTSGISIGYYMLNQPSLYSNIAVTAFYSDGSEETNPDIYLDTVPGLTSVGKKIIRVRIGFSGINTGVLVVNRIGFSSVVVY